MKITQINGQTDTATQRDATPEEIAELNKIKADSEAKKEAEVLAEAQAQAKRADALAKLAALGLEPDDLKALGL